MQTTFIKFPCLIPQSQAIEVKCTFEPYGIYRLGFRDVTRLLDVVVKNIASTRNVNLNLTIELWDGQGKRPE